MTRIQRFLLVAAFLAGVISSVYGQSLSAVIPLNKDAVEGRLSNGLRYVVHKNSVPAGSVEFRMVLNVGSTLEEQNEKGLSHFLEHMMFNGTEEYPSDTAVHVFRSMGIRYGFGLNAFTDNDKTIYVLSVPSGRKQNIITALHVFRSWLTSATLHPRDIEKEKKIIIQEIRDAVVPDVFYPAKVNGSRYADRPTLGEEKDVMQADSCALRQYYDKWYRPDLCTVIAVGDLEMGDMVEEIKEVFSSVVPRTSYTPERALYSLPVTGKDDVIQQEQDSLVGSCKLDLIIPAKAHPVVTYRDLRNGLEEQLFRKILSDRISENDRLKCHYTYSWYLSDVFHHSFEISASNESEIYVSVEELACILAQMKQHGILQSELEDAKKSVMEYLAREDARRTSSSYCDDYIDMVTSGDRYIGNRARYDFYKRVIAAITSDELEARADVFFYPLQRMILCYLYDARRSGTLDKNKAQACWSKGLASISGEYIPINKAKPDVEEVVDKRELSVGTLSQAGIVSERKFESIDVTEVVLSNGLRVAFKPMDSENREVMINLVGRGGFSMLPGKSYPYYNGMAAYIDMSGVDSLSPQELSDLCYKKEIAVSTLIDNYSHEMFGMAFTGDIENLLKLLYLKITSLKKNEPDFNSDIHAQIAGLGKESLLQLQLNRSPGRALQNIIARYSGNIHKNNKELTTEEDILKINLDSMVTFYERLFGETHQLTAIVIGNFDVDSIKPMVVQYLGALPVHHSELPMNDISFHFPDSVETIIIPGEASTRVNRTTLIHGEYAHSLKETMILKMMRDILHNRLLHSLREKQGLVYSPYVSVVYRAYPFSEFYFSVNYSCDKEVVVVLEKLLWDELDKLKGAPVSEIELNSIKESFMVSKRENLTPVNTSEWRDKLKEMYLENNSLCEFNRYDAILSDISTDDIQNAFREYIHAARWRSIEVNEP
ncbi:MAG TPA: hypothetical protein DDZ96_05640 [Porphyromonadaceae bacterium]|jgi:zinc protease|nr:hypothetical protein [Porphyromonadaceae bacterium]HBX21324.1 hypothetical protein [Porphyromonadaceae bacterium]